MQVRVPLLNANEDELTVVDVYVREGAEVRAGELLVTVESTKAASDIDAPVAGFVRRLSVAEGDRVGVGALICWLTETADEPLPEPEASAEAAGASDVRATKRARALAEEHGLDLAAIGATGIVKERDVLAFLERSAPARPFAEPVAGDHGVVILGAGGHARVIVDLLRGAHPELTIVGAVDDSSRPPADVLGAPVIGRSDRLEALRASGVERAALGVGAVTHNATRRALFERLASLGFELPPLVHAQAMVEPSVKMGRGVQIFAGAIVGSNVTLGDNVIVNSGVVVSHDCVIGAHTHLTPGAILAGAVTVGENTVIGMGVTAYLGITIGRDVTVSNGVHLLADVPDGELVRASTERRG